jgi:beta-lactamase class A
MSVCACASLRPGDPRLQEAERELARIEAGTGGRVGVAAVNLANGARLGLRAGERFAMCSTFKWALAALILQRVDSGVESLTRNVAYEESDLVSYSPVTKLHTGEGMTVGELCAATLTTSDNTAANLLLATLGGPAGFTAGVRAWGDSTTRLDRLEPQLNENKPGDPRDTTTPDAMVDLMATALFGSVLTPVSAKMLRNWMIATRTGRNRLRAGFGPDWTVGNRTGTSANNQNNDLCFALPGPLLIVSYVNAAKPMSVGINSVHAEVARAVVAALA